MEKCKYYNNAQTACSLMIDDIVPVFVSYDGKLRPWNDWGFGANNDNSLYKYFYDHFLSRNPEVMGTIFIPLESHNYLPNDSGMKVKKRNWNENDIPFFNKLKENFDFAFHGIKHTSQYNNSILSPTIFEFSELKLKDSAVVRQKIFEFEKLFGVKFSGGKFPGYFRKNNESFVLIYQLGLKWWAYTSAVNKKQLNNKHSYIKLNDSYLLDIPSNITGDIYLKYFYTTNSMLRKSYNRFKRFKRYFYNDNYLDYLYNNNLVITIQEHYLNQSFNGKRQKPNLFDDIHSISKIYSFLRGADLWHATCSEIANYLDSYDHTEIITIEDNKFEIKYSGSWDQMFLSFASANREIKNLETGKISHGVYKNNKWIYNNLKEGKYRLL